MIGGPETKTVQIRRRETREIVGETSVVRTFDGWKLGELPDLPPGDYLLGDDEGTFIRIEYDVEVEPGRPREPMSPRPPNWYLPDERRAERIAEAVGSYDEGHDLTVALWMAVQRMLGVGVSPADVAAELEACLRDWRERAARPAPGGSAVQQ